MYQDYEDVLKAYYQARQDIIGLTEALMRLHEASSLTYQLAQMLHEKHTKGDHHAQP